MDNDLELNKGSLDVVGIGNAIVDVLVQVEESFLQENNLKKGSMVLINEGQAEKLYSSIGPGIESSGGSAANTIAGLAQLKSKAAFIGRVKNDQLGEIFLHDINAAGAIFKTPAIKDGPQTARCLIFVTPDAQRTMCTYLGASILLEPNDLDLSVINNAKVLYLEGYLWDSPEAKRAFIEAARSCKESRGKIALSLSDSFCVERHRESFLKLIEKYVDILFANEEEIMSLYQTEDLNYALKLAKEKCIISAVTLGAKGSVISYKDKTWEISPYNLGKVIDTTGAGDLYAGGFLHGITCGLDLQSCGHIGSICSGQIVTQMGPRSQDCLRDLIKKHLKI